MATLPRKDLTGQRFGKWTVSGYSHQNEHHRHMWLVVCDCGSSRTLGCSALVSGKSKSCGCNRGAHLKTHGLYDDPAHSPWSAMLNRVRNVNGQDYADYGGRGITVCRDWYSFTKFLADIGPRPSMRHSIDRYPDLNGNYEPGNVRWALPSEQARNTRRNRLITVDGRTQCVSAWAEECGVGESVLRLRIFRDGVDPKEAMKSPSRRQRKDSIMVTIGTETKCLSEWARHYGLSPALVLSRVRRWGWNPLDALTTSPGAIGRWDHPTRQE